MPGNAFRVKPFRGGIKRAAVKAPSKPRSRSNVPAPEMPNGVRSRKLTSPAGPNVKVTTKARHGRSMPPVKQGTKLGTPGRHG